MSHVQGAGSRIGKTQQYWGDSSGYFAWLEMYPTPNLTWALWVNALQKMERFVVLNKPAKGFTFVLFCEGLQGSIASGFLNPERS